MKRLYETTQQLSEGLFDALLGAIMGGRADRAVKKISKDPEMKKAIDKYQQSLDTLKSAVDSYVAKHGKLPDDPELKKRLAKHGYKY